MTMVEELYEKISQYIVEKVLKQPQRKVALDEPLLSGGLIDSFHLVDLALFIEDTFGVQITDTELNPETFDTLNQLIELVQQRMMQGGTQ